MKNYIVRWEIDMEADSPEEAAVKALAVQRDNDPANSAVAFDVADQRGLHPCLWKRVDLSQEREASVKTEDVCEKCGRIVKPEDYANPGGPCNHGIMRS